jgi:hypothetical protein
VKILKWTLAVVGLLVVVFLAGAMLIDPKFKVERSATINAPAAKIYPLIAEPKSWPKWTVWNKRDPYMKLTFAGPESGKGAKWAWESKSEGNGNMEFTAADPTSRSPMPSPFPDMGMKSGGQLILTPEGNGTRVRWTNEGDLGGNPMSRWFAPFLDKMIGPDYEAGLAGLKALAEKP